MDKREIIRANRKYYRRFYRWVGISAALCVAVLAGSLVVGDSVRRSLRNRVRDRLADTRSAVVAADGFFGVSALQELGLPASSRAVLLSDGFVSRGGRLVPVMVWGVDALPDGTPLPPGQGAVNAELAKEIDPQADPSLVLRLPNEGLVPSSSLFVTGRYATSLRLECRQTLTAAQGGNLSLKNEQVLPYNVFVNRGELCELLGTGDKANLILTPADVRPGDLCALSAGTLGLRAERAGDTDLVEADGVFLRGNVLDKLCAAAPEANRCYSYLVNTIAAGAGEIPYSFATAMDCFEGRELPRDGALLSDYAARRLGVGVSDSIRVSYYVSDAFKQLSERTQSFRVTGIVPLSRLEADGRLSADYPGLADAASCSQWESDLPIDMDRIRPEDERYWSDHHATPKLILPYATMREAWSNTWGDATQLRVPAGTAPLAAVRAEDFGLTVVQPREQALLNAAGGVDFGGLFLALGFFIIAAALLLIYNPLSELYFRRGDELALYRTLGYSRKGLSRLLLREALPAVGWGAVAGLVAAVLYAGLVIFLLGNVWRGATHTDGFVLALRPAALLGGLAAGAVLAAGVLRLAVHRAVRAPKAPEKAAKGSGLAAACVSAVLLAALLCFGLARRASVAVFVLTGLLWMVCGFLWIRYFLRRRDASAYSRKGFVRQSLAYAWPDVLAGLVTLTLGVFITFAVGLNRRDFSDRRSLAGATGGFDWWCETAVPVYHDLSTAEGRARMGLEGLGDDARVLQCLKGDGDDASCLNLNKITTPGVLGFPREAFLESGFRIRENIFSLATEAEVLERMCAGDALYGLVDETVLTWGLMGALGDTLRYPGAGGGTVELILAGTLPNTVFQGSVLVPEELFRRVWNAGGSRVFLVRSGNGDAGRLLETALNEYGIRAVPAGERLRLFNSVTDAYLTIFLMLGGIGLLLGIVSYVIAVRKRLAGRRKDMVLLRSFGYGDALIGSLLRRENLPVPLLALLLGLSAAVVSVLLSFGGITPATWLTVAVISAAAVAAACLFTSRAVRETLQETKKDEDIVY